jgi:L-alanine-DL-glutamate epimerase-like enolase superfamily enzyme
MLRPNPRVSAVRITPIAFRDPPLLNVAGVHEPWALRSIIEVQTADGRIGLGKAHLRCTGWAYPCDRAGRA